MKGIFPGYYIVAAGFLVQATYLGAFFSFGIISPELEETFNWERAQISLASSINFVVMGCSMIFMGRLSDRFGPRLVLAVASLLYGLGYILLSKATAVWHLYVFFGILAGIGIGAHDVCTLSTVARWFVKRRGLFTGIVKAGAGVGQLAFPWIVAFLIATFSWRTTSVVIGLVLMMMIFMALVLKRDPALLGLRPDGHAPATAGYRQETRAGDDQESGITLRAALKTRQLWLLALAKLFDFYCLMTIVSHIVWHGIDSGLPKQEAALILFAIGASSIVGRLAVGRVSDQLGSKRAIQASFIFLFASLIFLQSIDNPKLLFAFAVLYGIAHGGFFTASSPAVAEYFGTRSHGVIFGFIVFCGTLGGAVGPPLAGRFFDNTASYDVPFLILTAFSVAGFAVTSQLKPLWNASVRK